MIVDTDSLYVGHILPDFRMVTYVNNVTKTYRADMRAPRKFDQTHDGGFAGAYRGRPAPEGWTEE